MVQIKQKSNKINITALITCFMLIMVFVFGCVQFAFASDSSEKNKLLDYANAQLSRRSDYKYYIGYSYEFRTSKYSSNFTLSNIESNKVCGYVNAYNTGTSWGFLSDSSFKFDGLYVGQWIECSKIWRVVSQTIYDPYDLECSLNPKLVKPIKRKKYFLATDRMFKAYDTKQLVKDFKDKFNKDEFNPIVVEPLDNSLDGDLSQARRLTHKGKRRKGF